ncbi:MAG: LLM class flavin-dependent oxidoreductase [Chloroflexi bacterium]|nr:LLM class flavin-dependent oxidoreductase [Chloroflexota bacterium]
MKFGIFDHVERRDDVALDRQYADRLELIAQADRGGIYGYHVAEHHHSPLSMVPSQGLYLAAIAAKTERINFGPLVYVLPLYHPIRLVEEICMVDNLSGGRYQVGIGKGAPIGEEFAMWGGDPAEVTERFEETLKILMLGLTQEFVSFSGKYYQFKDLWMELKPKQTPHPPFWYAGNPANAGRYGANFINFGTIESLPGTVEIYKESLQKRGEENDLALPLLSEPLYGASKWIYLADTDEAAMRRARTAYEAYRAHFRKPMPGGKWRRPTPIGPIPDTGRFPWDPDFDQALAGEQLVVGSTATVREFVERYASESDCNYLVTSVQWGDLSHEEASYSLGLFISEVMPAVG